MRTLSDYLALVTHEHQKPNFLAWLTALLQPFVDLQTVAMALPTDFSLTSAVGAQLDVVGLWVGISRNLATPITGVFFSWDTDNLGWDQGQWQGQYQTGDQLTVLDDDDYRLLLQARIASNHWDGTVPGAYAVWNIAFASTGNTLLMQDNQNMSLDIIVLGPGLTAVQTALLLSGELGLKPAGVRIAGYYFTPGPIFGWDAETSIVQGWDQGLWLIPTDAGD